MQPKTAQPEPFEVHVQAASADDNAVDLLQDACTLSRSNIKSAMTKGAVWITRGTQSQRLRRARRPLQAGDQLHLYCDMRVLEEVPPEPMLIADLGGYSVWHKPRGMRSQGSKWGDHCTIMRWAEQHLTPERTSFTVHRLDLATSGLIVIAHSKTIAAAFGRLFQDRQVIKRYRAVVWADLSKLSEPLLIEDPIDGKSARSKVSFIALSADGKKSLVDVRIYTGRKHQIRRHLSAQGYPIVGDRLYGDGENDGVDMQLTAYLLGFNCPIEDAPTEFQLPDSHLPTIN